MRAYSYLRIFLWMGVCVSLHATDFESQRCKEFMKALDVNAIRNSISRLIQRPLDEAATLAQNLKRVGWACRQCEVLREDAEELRAIRKEAIPLITKRLEAQKEEEKHHPHFVEPESIAASKAVLSAIDDIISVPFGYPNLGKFLDHHFATSTPSLAQIRFYTGAPSVQLKMFADFHKNYYLELFREVGSSDWQNLKSSHKKEAHREAVAKVKKMYPNFPVGRTVPSAEQTGVLDKAVLLSADSTVAQSHRDLIADHLAYLEKNGSPPSVAFQRYLVLIEARPQE